MSTLELPDNIHDLCISYPQYEKLKKRIARAHRMSKLLNEPQCVSLEGMTGTGRSTLVKHYASSFPRIETPTGTEIPIFYMETPASVTTTQMASTMLSRLGDPAAHIGSLPAKNDRLIDFQKTCKIQMIILDDFQHLIHSDTDEVLQGVSDWLKVLIKEMGIPFLVVGIEGKVKRILQANPQLSRLFAARLHLDPFTWNEKDERGLQDFAVFVNTVEEYFTLPVQTRLARAELLRRLHYATDGVVANIVNLISTAMVSATERELTGIDQEALSEAFDERLMEHMQVKTNPFEARWGKTFVSPEERLFDPSEGANNRSRGRKLRLPAASEVLKKKK